MEDLNSEHLHYQQKREKKKKKKKVCFKFKLLNGCKLLAHDVLCWAFDC